MSNAATPTTRLQGCLYVPSAVTIRFTDDPLGVPTTSNFVINARTLFRSHDDLIRAWQTRLTIDFGMLAPTIEISGIGGGLGFVTITTLGNNFSVDWSFVGNGTTIANFLGFAANIVNQPSGYAGSPTPAAFYPTLPAQVLRRSSTRRPRGQMITLSGASRSQHGTSPSDADEAELEVELWFGPTNPHTAQGYFETYFLNGLETYSSELQFTILHGSDSYFVCFAADDDLVISSERVEESWDNLWRARLQVVTVASA